MQNFASIKDYIHKSYICIDTYGDDRFCARLYKTPENEPKVFNEWIDIVNELDQYYDEISYPQASTIARKFKDAPKPSGAAKETDGEDAILKDEADSETKPVNIVNGQRATFILQVVYRQHASWQGSLCWVEKNVTKAFRSELELFKLIDLALSEK